MVNEPSSRSENYSVTALSWNQFGILAIATSNGKVFVWNSNTRDIKKVFTCDNEEQSWIWDVKWHPNGYQLAFSTMLGNVIVKYISQHQ